MQERTPLNITPRIRWMYGFGSAAYGVKDNGFSFFLMIFYNQVLGLEGYLAGLAIMVALIFDAISDPLVGYWSDNTHSRWGRRHPFMYFSAVPVAISYYFLWNPIWQDLEQIELFAYLTCTAILVRFFITLYEIPSTSIVAELTDDYDERTRLLGYRYMFGWYGGLVMAVLGWGYFFNRTELGIVEPSGYVGYSITGSVVIFLSIIISSASLHKYIPSLPKAAIKTNKTITSIFSELKETLSNRNFLVLFLAGLFAAIGAGISTNFNAYINTYFWEFTPTQVAAMTGGLFLAPAAANILTPLITRRWDKREAAIRVYSVLIFWSASPIILRLMDFWPSNDSPLLYPFMCAHIIIDVTMIIIFGIIQSSMLADVVEHSQERTGRREEGLFFASRTFASKATSGVGTFIAGIVLTLINFPQGASPGEVPEEVLFDLGVVYGPTLMAFYATALFCITFYTISRQGHKERTEKLASKS